MRERFYSARDVSQKREVALRREVDAVERRLREREVGSVPQADVGRGFGEQLLDFSVELAPRVS